MEVAVEEGAVVEGEAVDGVAGLGAVAEGIAVEGVAVADFGAAGVVAEGVEGGMPGLALVGGVAPDAELVAGAELAGCCEKAALLAASNEIVARRPAATQADLRCVLMGVASDSKRCKGNAIAMPAMLELEHVLAVRVPPRC